MSSETNDYAYASASRQSRDSDDMMIAAFADHQILVGAIPGLLALLACFFVGTFGNLNVVAATVLNRKLRSTCCYLIALSSIFDTVHLVAHVTTSFTVFTGINVIPLSQCFYLQALPIAGLVGGQIVVLLIAVDRLLSLIFPIWHRSLRKSAYLSIHLLTCGCSCGSYLYMGYLNQKNTPNEYVFCIILEGVHGYLVDVFSSCAVLTNVATVAIYAAVLLFVRKRGADAATRQIMKSLTWIIAAVSGGWFATVTCATVVSYFLKLSPTQTPTSFAYIGIFVNIGCAANSFILYKCSSEYRRQLQRQLRFIFCRCSAFGDAIVVASANNNTDSRDRVQHFDNCQPT